TLSLDTVTVQNSTAQGSAGTNGGPDAPGANGTAAWGGAIYVAAGSLTLNNSTLASDAAVGGAGGAGGAGGQTNLYGGPGGAGGSSLGGAIYLAAGTLTLTNATLSNDSAQGGAGGTGGAALAPAGPGGAGGSSQGGAIFVAGGTVTMTYATVYNDSAPGGVGGLAGASGGSSQ